MTLQAGGVQGRCERDLGGRRGEGGGGPEGVRGGGGGIAVCTDLAWGGGLLVEGLEGGRRGREEGGACSRS